MLIIDQLFLILIELNQKYVYILVFGSFNILRKYFGCETMVYITLQ